MPSNQQKSTEPTVEVKLIRAHRHGGKRHKAGDKITVRRSLVPKLVAWGAVDENAGGAAATVGSSSSASGTSGAGGEQGA